MNRKANNFRGMTVLYSIVGLFAIMGIMSLAIDYGRVQCAKTELRNAVDSATRYAVTGISDSSYVTKAQSAASQNRVDGSAFALQNSDVELGVWNTSTKTFTATSTSPNAIRITGRRTAARGTAIPLLFGQVAGMNSVDLTASSVATFTAASSGYQVVGLNGINMGSSNNTINSNTGETGTVTVASNGNWNFNGGIITGNILYRGSAPNGTVSGTKTLMPSNLSFTTPTTPGGIPGGNQYTNVNMNSGTFTVTAGNYSAFGVSSSNCTFHISGVVNIYISGNVTFGSGTNFTYANSSSKLNIFITQSAGFNYNTTSTFYGSVYCPSSPANINSGTVIGTLIASQISMGGSGKIRYDSDYPISSTYANGSGGGGGGGSSTGTVSMVK